MDDDISELMKSSIFIVDEEIEEVDEDDDDQTLSDPSEVLSDPEEDLGPEGACGGQSADAGRESGHGSSFRSLYEDLGAQVVSATRSQVVRLPHASPEGEDSAAARRTLKYGKFSSSSGKKDEGEARQSRKRRSKSKQFGDPRLICGQGEVHAVFVGSSVAGVCKTCGGLAKFDGNYVSHFNDPQYEDPGPERMSPRFKEQTPSPTKRKALKHYVGGRGPTESPPLTPEEMAEMSSSAAGWRGTKSTAFAAGGRCGAESTSSFQGSHGGGAVSTAAGSTVGYAPVPYGDSAGAAVPYRPYRPAPESQRYDRYMVPRRDREYCNCARRSRRGELPSPEDARAEPPKAHDKKKKSKKSKHKRRE